MAKIWTRRNQTSARRPKPSTQIRTEENRAAEIRQKWSDAGSILVSTGRPVVTAMGFLFDAPDIDVRKRLVIGAAQEYYSHIKKNGKLSRRRM